MGEGISMGISVECRNICNYFQSEGVGCVFRTGILLKDTTEKI